MKIKDPMRTEDIWQYLPYAPAYLPIARLEDGTITSW
jgi:hypothetical protein